MLNVSRSLPDIAVLRGGKEDFALSLEEGKEVLLSLTKLGYKPLDVLIGKDGNWNVQGMPTDAHAVYSRAHTIVDTTRDANAPHIALAHRMGISLLFSKGHRVCMDREDMYRLLRMQNIHVPDTSVVRSKAKLEPSHLKNIWSKNHIPLMLRPLERKQGVPTKLVTSYVGFEEAIKDCHSKGIDVQVLTYRKSPTTSIAVIPNFRGEKLYTPISVETFVAPGNLPSRNARIELHTNATDEKKEMLQQLVREVCDALTINGPACIDVIPHNNGYMVVNVDRSPSLGKDGRFMKSLSSTGVHIGEYIHSTIEKEMESNYYNNHERTR